MESYALELNAIDKIINGKGFINLVINNALRTTKLDESRASLFTKIVYGVVENKIYLDYQLSFYLKNDKIADIYVLLEFTLTSLNSVS